MSEFVKKLNQVSHGAGHTIGFGAVSKPKTTPMLLIARLTSMDEDSSTAAVSGKVDALLYDIKDSAGQAYTLAKLAENDDKIPWGVRLQKASIEGINRLAEAGCDFVILDPEAAAGVLQEETMGKVLEAGVALGDGLVRAIGQLSVDALLLTEDKQSGSLTINQLINYQRISGFAGKPLLAFLPRELSDLEVLLDAGIKGVVMDLSVKDMEARLKEVQEAIQKLSGLKKRKAKGGDYPVLPSSTPASNEVDDY